MGHVPDSAPLGRLKLMLFIRIFVDLMTCKASASMHSQDWISTAVISPTAEILPDAGPHSLLQVVTKTQPLSLFQKLSHTASAKENVTADSPQAARENGTTDRQPLAGEISTPMQGSTSGLFRQLHFSSMGTLTAYLVTACLTASAIVVLYWSKGAAVISRIIIYLLALATMKLSVKLIFVEHGFNYPKFVTAVHFIAGAIVAFGILIYRKQSTPPQSSPRAVSDISKDIIAPKQTLAAPTAREFWQMIVPIAMSFAISVAANNVALLYSTAAFTEIVGATSPVVSILLIVCMGMPFDKRLLGPTLLVVAGCALSTSGEVRFSAVGMAFCMVSMLGRSLKSTLQQRIMTGDSKAKFDPVTLLAWMCIPSAAMMMLWSLSVEGVAPFLMMQEHTNRFRLVLSILISCVNATILNLSNLFCVKDLGAVGVQLVAQMKSVLTVLGAVALFHEAVTPLEVFGFVGVLIGVFLFSRMEQEAKKTPS